MTAALDQRHCGRQRRWVPQHKGQLLSHYQFQHKHTRWKHCTICQRYDNKAEETLKRPPLYQLHLHSEHSADLKYPHLSEERETIIYLWGYSKDVDRTKCQALTTTRLTHSPFTIQIARIRRYIKLNPIFKYKDVQHTNETSQVNIFLSYISFFA